MELQQIRYFLTVAKFEHISKAANILHIAQPALSQCIKRLENELGILLFDRKGRNIVLNNDGRRLQQRLQPIIAALDSVPREFSPESIHSDPPIRLNISAGSILFTKLLIDYRNEHPDASFKLMQNAQPEDSDITISTVPADTQFPRGDMVLAEEIFIAVPLTSKYAGRTSLRLDELEGEPFISFSGSKPLRNVCDNLCSSVGMIPDVVFESDSPTVVRSLIEAGLGVGFWPAFSWGAFSSTLAELIPIGSPVCRREIVIHYNETPLTNQSSRDFFRYIVTKLKTLPKNYWT